MHITSSACWLLLAVLLAGCAGTAEPPASTTPAAAETATVTATEAATEAPIAAPPAEPATQPPADTPAAAAAEQPAADGTPIRVIIGDTILAGRLWDNAAARDLAAQLPLTLTFSDYNSLEKIASLPQKLSTDGAPAGDDPFPRDIGYYAPWGNLVFYYGDVGYFNGIVRIGQFDGSVDAIAGQTGDFTARIELVD